MAFVSILIPARNEENFIAACLDSVLQNDYASDQYEILVIDGMSTDRTREIVTEYSTRFPNIRIVSNPDKTFPCAVNTGIRQSRGEVIMILGAHAIYDRRYISLCVYHLFHSDADNSGGVLETIGQNESFTGKAISHVLTNPFGVGNATFRTGSKTLREVDTVFGGCYRREVFDRIGLFNENLVSSSDIEFNKRLRNAGGRILLDPEIKATYFTRSTFRKFMRNNFRNGFWVIYPMKFVNHMPVSLRHFIPLIFIFGLAGSFVLSLLLPVLSWFFPGLLIIYFLTGFYFSVKGWGTIRDTIYRVPTVLILPFLFFLLHMSYGLGSLWGAINLLVKKR
jgi:glycosyltransferase involved in cell wall biosynthesis